MCDLKQVIGTFTTRMKCPFYDCHKQRVAPFPFCNHYILSSYFLSVDILTMPVIFGSAFLPPLAHLIHNFVLTTVPTNSHWMGIKDADHTTIVASHLAATHGDRRKDEEQHMHVCSFHSESISNRCSIL